MMLGTHTGWMPVAAKRLPSGCQEAAKRMPSDEDRSAMIALELADLPSDFYRSPR